MTQKNIAKKSLAPEMAATLARLGNHIRIARKRRGITMTEMSSRMFVTRKTLSRLENGDPGVSLTVLISALWVMGFEKDLLAVCNPEKDKVGIYRERQRLPQRVRTASTADNLDF
ncbi:MAG: helix-turn-helix domain-containing protein [Desulfobacteraceae bacterium]|nr:helix-turn-helix domain-containing protein [Desulfobacteraceae bacterium]MBC2757300.1 helix-turn-helix domain-containing protein [Desulfobacteraceae bacterium]